MGTKINEMTMTEIVNRAVELGFPMRKAKGEVYFHWNSSRELEAYQFVLEHDPELADEDDDYPDDAA
ncbi:hypothetical protein FYJ85_17545 [Victivallaceae bacterium BBE-744-WT-12]|jgi:hypothetical protein|uniref:Uncharacterized protein n=1 Tax=Victivallis lenta TaxID=2606640 RepID=A0A844G6S6_9BACT|nr:hypothetical protein [Victivallis lenta]MST98843.1 hypothetical protein [Victivallis lenta]